MSGTALNALKVTRPNNKASQLKSVALREAARVFILAIGLPGLSAGCELFIDKEVMFLRAAEGHATQQDIHDRLGTPIWTVRRPDGETVWVYQMTQREKGGNNILDITGFWCDEYVLAFDRKGILQNWDHKSQKHRDPPSPSNCVADGFMALGSVFQKP